MSGNAEGMKDWSNG